MYQQEFNSIIKDKNRLLEFDGTLIRNIAERYPYCQPVQALYAKKLQSMASPLAQDQLRKTAAMVFDRTVLYQWMEKTQLARPLLMHVVDKNVDVLDKREEIVEIEENAEALAEITPQEEAQLQELITVDEEVTTEDTAVSETVLEELSEKEPEVVEPIIENPDEIPVAETEEEIKEEQELLSEEKEPVENVKEEEVQQELPPLEEKRSKWPEEELEALLHETPMYDLERELGPLPAEEQLDIRFEKPETIADDEVVEKPVEGVTNSFIGWLQAYNTHNTGHLVLPDAAHAPVRLYQRTKSTPEPAQVEAEMPNTEDVAGELARKSIQSDAKLVTETYARILVMQGKYPQAIDMYRKLSLLKPQKSDYFAALIDQLVKRIK